MEVRTAPNPSAETLAFRERLRSARARHNLNKAAFARMLGVSQSVAANIESGKIKNPTWETRRRMERALDELDVMQAQINVEGARL